MQRCSKCNEEKGIDLFPYRNKQKNTRSIICKACNNAYAQVYRAENIAKIAKSQATYYQEVYKMRKPEYDKSRLDVVRESSKLRYAQDKNYRMKKVLRTRFSKLVKCGKMSHSMMDYLGMTITQFTQWIEWQFISTMSWDNHGVVWEIDHVVPCKLFDLSNIDDVRVCFRWNNLRPLIKQENAEKSAKLDLFALNDQMSKVNDYIILNPGTKAMWKHIAGME